MVLIFIYLSFIHVFIKFLTSTSRYDGCLLNCRLVFSAILAAALDYRLIEQGRSFKNEMKGMNSMLVAGLRLCQSRLPIG